MNKTSTYKYKPHSLPPKRYLAWHEWADVQDKKGLKQKQCKKCGLWKYPQERDTIVELKSRLAKNRIKKGGN